MNKLLSILMLSNSFLVLLTVSLKSEIQSITTSVNGVDCKFCAHDLAQLLTSIDGVKSTNIAQSKHAATLNLKPKNNIDLSLIEKKLKSTKFGLRGVEITADGTIVKRGKNYVFEVARSPYKVYLLEEDNIASAQIEAPRKNWMNKFTGFFTNLFTKKDKTAKRIQELCAKKLPVTLTCGVHEHSKHTLGVAGNRIKVAAIKQFSKKADS